VIVEKGNKLGEWVLKKIREAGWHYTRCERGERRQPAT